MVRKKLKLREGMPVRLLLFKVCPPPSPAGFVLPESKFSACADLVNQNPCGTRSPGNAHAHETLRSTGIKDPKSPTERD